MEETGKKFFLRTATADDIRLLYDWANDPLVRRNSFNTEPIAWETHEAWFARMMANDRVRQYIYMMGEEPVGQVRISLDAAGEEAEIGYSIAAPYRGKGHGRRMLALLEETVREQLPGVKRLCARVKENNTASVMAFEHTGYEMKCLVYERSL